MADAPSRGDASSCPRSLELLVRLRPADASPRLLAPASRHCCSTPSAFGFILDRPLALGFLRHQIDAKLARGASIDGPKLVILAGSNGPYSHRCETIEPILGMPCVNGGVAVGIGLDYLFARWQPLLHPGDIVYLPMEEAQYVRTRAGNRAGAGRRHHVPPRLANAWPHCRPNAGSPRCSRSTCAPR